METIQKDFQDIHEKASRLEALITLSNDIREKERRALIPFNDFLFMASENPNVIFRNIFQLFQDMVENYSVESQTEYFSSVDNLSFVEFDCTKLFVEGCEDPFFADKLFAYRFVNLVKGFKKGIQNNRIYLFEGPPGSGKSTFLNNLLNKMEVYTKSVEGAMYKTVWQLDVHKLGGYDNFEKRFGKIFDEIRSPEVEDKLLFNPIERKMNMKFLEIPCPNNDHPILQIPKTLRRKFLDELIPCSDFKTKLFHDKEYEWVLKDIPCSICNSIYTKLLERINDPLEVFNMISARVATFERQFGRGISVFNPGDQVQPKPITNENIQNLINELLRTDEIKYLYSDLALTNNGILALMDIKEHNVERLLSLHGIISDGVHKVEMIEERIKSLFLGILNPEDKKHYENVKSFQDRIITVTIPYILDYKTEVGIYINKFGEEIKNQFLPRVLDNFAKIIISSRLEKDAPVIRKWINPDKYNKHLDKNLFLLKMELYSGKLPAWLSEDDAKRFDRQTSKEIYRASEVEGKKGISGRQSLNIFSSFFIKFASTGKMITMEVVKNFFLQNEEYTKEIPEAFIKSLESLYEYHILQEVKEAIYFFNEKQITEDILDYLYAINFELGETVVSSYTNNKIEISEEYFKDFEAMYLGTQSTQYQRLSFRKSVHADYITRTLSHEIRIDGKHVKETEQFKNLFERYIKNLKENALAPYIDNENFHRAVTDYKTSAFNSYDHKVRRDVTRLIENMGTKFNYSEDSAKEITLYVLDKNIAKRY
jgi:predicted Ser/Thr protein kinase